ncbi:Protein of unknown function [Loktanella fryxellensis]|uniref:AsmA-like C-terminal region n=1 Tax=Loktanella fryxellensis TaxID=245187 RepID=A0A1H7YQJ7_9RHOB|nr:AsmA-like C-terminal region-containing protein [Loktanella fryxellensis]SEM48191.1 Protein of unknown function [Loktanella fryxellensis]
MTETDPAPAARPARTRRRRGAPRGPTWQVARVLAALLSMPLIFALIVLVALFDRDITAPGWMTREVASRASAMLGGGRVSFGEITLRIGADLHPRIRLSDTLLRDADGAPLARVAEVDATISPRGLLFDQSALVQEVALRGSAIALTRDVQGRIRLAFDLPETGGGALLAEGLGGLVAQLNGLRDRTALSALERVSLAGLDLTFRDDLAGRVWTTGDGAFTLALTRAAVTAEAQLRVMGDDGATRLGLSLTTDRATQAAQLRVRVNDAPARDLASQSAALWFLDALDAPLSATLATGLDADGRLGPLDVTLQIGAGAVQPQAGTPPLPFDAVDAALRYDPVGQRLTFRRVAIRAPAGGVVAQGQAIAQDFVRGLPTALVGQFRLTDVALSPGDLYPEPLTLEQADIDLRLTLDPFRLDVGQVTLTDPALRLAAKGHLTATPDGWDAGVDLTSPALTPAGLLRLWPERLRPGTRAWFANNLLAGDLSAVTAGWRLRPGQPARIAAGFAYEAATVRYLRNLPLITDGAGYATLADGAFALRLDAGQVIAPQGGALDVAGSVLQIPDVTMRNAPLELDLATTGSITATLSLLDQPPFGYLRRANLPVTLADGRAAVSARVVLPLKQRMTPDDVDFSATAQLTRLRSETLVAGRTLAGSDLAVTVDREGLSVGGDATLDGVPVTGTFTQGFRPGAAPPQVTGRVALTPEALDTFGIALPPGTVSGAGGGDLTVTLPRGAPPTFSLTSDLGGLGLSVPAIGYAKGRGATGALEVSGSLGPRPVVDRLRLRAPGLAASGRVDLAAGGGLAAATFDSVTVGDWFAGPVTLQGRGPGQGVGVIVRGGTFDLSRADLGGAGGGGGAGIPISVQLDELRIAGDLRLTQFKGAFDTTGGFAGDFQGLFNGAAPVRGAVSPVNGRSAVRVVADDAGAVLRAGNFLPGATGGTLDLTLRPAPDAGSFDGTVAVRQLRVRDVPAIAALLDAISVIGLLQQLDGQGLAFDTVDAQFRLTPDRIVVTQASAVGPGLGISVDGLYTLASRTFDLQGVVSPFYFVNAIGSVLTRPGEGLIGINFTLGGTPAAPQVGVNPFSVLTPGLFRDIFRRPPPVLAN